ncbi:MAG: aminotransferase class III-fold pyridoxal phosphate-dependent enzyme [Alphaproteobacteria bacterium]|nr:aminotransferase class III-fold pyridoxal phosphate-dependent enzyme [Alphaproteobacteria bacterium]
MSDLISIEECENFPIEKIWDLYRHYVSGSQVDLIASFGFGRDVSNYAEGCYIYTKNGDKVLDFTGGIGVLNHGHNHPRIVEIRRKFQEQQRMEVHKNFFSPYVAALSHNLAQLLPGDLDVSYFPNSGSEAVEGAVKMAYKYHGGKRQYILHADISFHGKLMGAASLTGSPELHFHFPGISGARKFEFGNIDSVRDVVAELRQSTGGSDVYAIILEPMSASSLRECSAEFLLSLRELCTAEDIVLIFDEVYTGWAKTGSLFYFMRHDGLLPDIVTYAKSFGGGKSSISGYTARTPIFKKAYDNLHDATLHSTTYYGFGEECATAIEAINVVVEENFVERAQNIHEKLRDGLHSLQNKYPDLIEEVRGTGALHGLILKPNRAGEILGNLTKTLPSNFFKDDQLMNKIVTAAVIYELYQSHKVMTYYGSNREIPLIAAPSLIAEDSDVDWFLDALDQSLSLGFVKLTGKFIKSKVLGP